ncbi:MAG: ATP-binding cassette domain-containing protein [Phenylobacterium sp.]|uniref:ATP-binding cassette domain-containing protein n=1 Tax=Phenylobacterium sp. TaxID=1871053 RepID=UPI0025DEC9C3|nr:ATP-binding cassette domain-containing protein [Phenylobacterium sp.]MBI1196997.1 ATP-binding cassette domain-containing protein [Phenylobacterium sp.]
MSERSPTRRFLAGQLRRRRGDLLLATVAAVAAAGSATLLLGVSGWFLAGAALAGLAGPAAVQAFNYLLPSAGLRAFAILRTVGRYGERLFGHRAALQALAALRPALFAGLAAAPARRALALSAGEASARLVQDVDAVETAVVRRPAPWAAAAAAGAAAAVIALASPWAALVFLAGLGLQLAAAARLAPPLTTAPAHAQLAAAGRLKDALGAYGPAAVELHCFGLAERAVDAVMAEDAALSVAALRRQAGEAALELIETLAGAAAVLGVAVVVRDTPMPLSALAVLAALAGLEGAASLLRAAEERSRLDAAIERLDAAIGDPTPRGGAAPADADLWIDGERLAPGARLAIAGPSGGGKTSLLLMLVGLREAEAGRIRIGGVALEDQPPGWARGLFAYAPQDAGLISGTVAENLRLADPAADDAALWAALDEAQLAERVRRLPQGPDTWIGDAGATLSGGERRRLALARAYLRDAPWLLLDEPTEGLDQATERAVVAALAARLARTGQGLIVVSHRDEPLRLASRRLEVQPFAARQAT